MRHTACFVSRQLRQHLVHDDQQGTSVSGTSSPETQSLIFLLHVGSAALNTPTKCFRGRSYAHRVLVSRNKAAEKPAEKPVRSPGYSHSQAMCLYSTSMNSNSCPAKDLTGIPRLQRKDPCHFSEPYLPCGISRDTRPLVRCHGLPDDPNCSNLFLDHNPKPPVFRAASLRLCWSLSKVPFRILTLLDTWIPGYPPRR